MLIKKILYKQSRVFLFWLVSYITILIVPLIASIVIYFVSAKIIENEGERVNQASMRHLTQLMDDQLAGIRRICIDTGWDNQVIEMAYAKKPLPSIYRSTVSVGLMKYLKMQSASNSLIDFMYIYFKNTDYVITNSSMNETMNFYSFYHESEHLPYDDWYNVINDVHPWEYVKMKRISEFGKINDSIAFLQTIPVEYPRKPLGTVAVLIDGEKFNNILHQAKWIDESTILILNKSNEVLASSDPISLNGALSYDGMDTPGKCINTVIGDEKVVVTYDNSSILDWKYVSVIPQKIFHSKVKYVRNIIVISLLACIILGGAFAYLYTLKNYNHVKKILKTISTGKEGTDITPDVNEYEFINFSIKAVIDENKRINQKLKKQYGILKTNFIMKLLKGKAGNSSSIAEAMENYGLHISSNYFAVMLVVIDDINGFFPLDSEKNPGEGVELAKLVIANIIQELIEQHNRIYTIEDDDVVVCLINFTSAGENFGVDYLEQVSVAAERIIRKEFKISYTTAISSIHENPYGIQEAYQEALEALDYRLFIGTGNIIKYDSVKKSEKPCSSHSFTLELQQKFINCIRAGEMDSAMDIIENVIDQSFQYEVMSLAMAKCVMFSIVNTVINAVSEISATIDKDFIEHLNPVDRLLKLKSIVEMKSEMKVILKSIGEYTKNIEVKKINNLVADIKSYINDNYSNPDLSLTRIAEHMDMNATYISRYFKEQTGEGILDCINRIRVENSKTLLLKKSISINDISERVGFCNTNTFIRVFKKLEGITPGKFRDMQ